VLSNKQTLILGHSKSDGDTPTELINLRNFCSDVSVPRLKLLESQAGVFPGRRFQLQPQGRDTLHEEAQYPNQYTLRVFQDHPDDTEDAQMAFVSALTASALRPPAP